MTPQRLYTLTFLFDEKQVGGEDTLKKKCVKAMKEQPKSYEVVSAKSSCLKLTIRGSLEDVDRYHLRLNESFLNKEKCSFVRLLDEAGDKIREQAYPILAQIEQTLRAFINRAMAEVKGANWWDTIVPFMTQSDIQEHADQVKNKLANRERRYHHPLELLTFESLVSIVTAKFQYLGDVRGQII